MKNESNKTEPHYIKAIRMKPEFDQLKLYSEKLKFMDDHFEGLSGIGDPKGGMIISIWPPQTKDEIILFNERFIKRYENFKDDIFTDYSFDRLKQRYDNEILKINDSNFDLNGIKNLIKDYTQEQLEIYCQRMTDSLIKRTKNYYKGNWDLSKKVIDTSFLQARAWENYIGFLQSKINKLPKEETTRKPSFESLFKDPDNAKKVKEIFEIKGYILNGKWQGLSGNKGELLSAYYVLRPLLKPHKITPVAIIFYNEFGLTVERKNKGGYISPDMLRKEPFNNDREEFEKIFAFLIK